MTNEQDTLFSFKRRGGLQNVSISNFFSARERKAKIYLAILRLCFLQYQHMPSEYILSRLWMIEINRPLKRYLIPRAKKKKKNNDEAVAP